MVDINFGEFGKFLVDVGVDVMLGEVVDEVIFYCMVNLVFDYDSFVV